MTTYVLVHGAFRGAWAWSRVTALLAAAGHTVRAPDLSADAEGLATWVDEVVRAVGSAGPRVVLVGHSQGGLVVTAALEQVADRVRHVVLLDAAVPEHGERAVDLSPTNGHPLPARDVLVPPRPLTPGGDLDAATAAWANERLVATPFAPSLDVVSLTSAVAAAVPRTYAFCAGTPAGYPSATTRARLDARKVPYVVLDTGHDAALTRPDLVAELLVRYG